MRQRKKRKTRSNLVLDIRKLYVSGMTGDLAQPIEVVMPGELEVEIGFCLHILETHPAHVDALAVLGDAYTRSGEYEKGLELDLRLAQLKPENGMVCYNLACSYALTGQTDKALRNLSKAVDLGYNDVEHLCEDNDLAALKSDPRFQTLVQKLVKQYGPGRKNKEK